jgi:hypothetical protein
MIKKREKKITEEYIYIYIAYILRKQIMRSERTNSCMYIIYLDSSIHVLILFRIRFQYNVLHDLMQVHTEDLTQQHLSLLELVLLLVLLCCCWCLLLLLLLPTCVCTVHVYIYIYIYIYKGNKKSYR